MWKFAQRVQFADCLVLCFLFCAGLLDRFKGIAQAAIGDPSLTFISASSIADGWHPGYPSAQALLAPFVPLLHTPLMLIWVGMLLSDRFAWLKPCCPAPVPAKQQFHAQPVKQPYAQQLYVQLQLLSQVNDAVVAVDQSERIIYWNRGAVKLYGLPAEAVLGRSLAEVLQYEWVHPEDRQFADKALAREGYWRGENTHRSASGDRIFVESSITVLKDSSGKAIGRIGILQDVTCRKQREAQLQDSQSRLTAELELLNDDLERRVIQRTIELELTNRLLEQEVADRKLSEARYRSLALASAEAVWTTEASGQVETAQPSWERLTGQCFPDYRGTGWLSAIHPDDRSRVAAQWAAAVTTRSTYDSEHRVQLTNGSYRYFSVRAVPVFDESGNLLEWVGVHTDIAEAKQAEQALRTSEQRFRRLAESNIFGVAFGNFAGKILDANDYFLQITGYTRSDLEAGQLCWIDMTPPEYLPLDWNAGTELQQRGVSIPFEKEYIRKDGSRVPVLIGSALMNEPYDEQTEIVSFYVDLTARKQAEAEREKLLSQEQAARQQAEAANRIKDEFLAVLSHELRSPLNPILGWTRLLRTRSFDPATTDRALETIERNAKLQTQLIEDLLDVSRILRGKMNLQMLPVDLIGVVEAAIETVAQAADAKSIQIEFLPSPALYPVIGDTARLQQVAWNLLSNAIKFTSNGGRVMVKLERVEGERVEGEQGSRGAEEQGSKGAGEQGSGGTGKEFSHERVEYPSSSPYPSSPHPPIPPSPHARLTVLDTGKGIPADFLPHVFEYFRQADSSITRNFGGLGLGLAIVRHLVELHNGTVSVHSAGEGQGATFTVCLPLIQSDALLLADPSPLSRLPKAELLQGVRVLAVDDEADMRDYVSVLLQEAGATVLLASSAREALTLLLKTVPDILISDIGMPQVDGYTLLKQIRQLSAKQGGQVPAIALTAYAAEYDYHQAMAAGFQCHLSKPIDPDDLVQAIRQLLDAKQFS